MGFPKVPWRQPFPVDSWLACCAQSRLQTGICTVFGKPKGTVARAPIGQVIMSICPKLQNKDHVIEALCRARFKFPGRQKIHISKEWGFTKFNADEFENMVAEKQLNTDGCGVKYIPNRGSLDKWWALHSWEPWHCLFLTHAHQRILLSRPKEKKKSNKKTHKHYNCIHQFTQWPILFQLFMKPSDSPLRFLISYPVQQYDMKFMRPVLVKMVLHINLLKDEALLQRHQSTMITIYKWQKDLKRAWLNIWLQCNR